MDVRDAVAARRSVRAFLPDPVDDDLLADLLTRASRAPSGGNLQPWRVYVVNGDAMTRFRAHLAECPPFEEPGYDVYPASLWEPYRTNRFTVGEQLYASIGIARDDKNGRLAQFAKNGDSFGAPANVFCFIDRGMGMPQWSDLGMFLQTFMLLATEAGIDTCPQEFWTSRQQAVTDFVEAPDELMLFCGMAVGHADPAAPINGFTTGRQPLEEWCTFC